MTCKDWHKTHHATDNSRHDLLHEAATYTFWFLPFTYRPTFNVPNNLVWSGLMWSASVHSHTKAAKIQTTSSHDKPQAWFPFKITPLLWSEATHSVPVNYCFLILASISRLLLQYLYMISFLKAWSLVQGTWGNKRRMLKQFIFCGNLAFWFSAFLQWSPSHNLFIITWIPFYMELYPCGM